MPRSGGRLNLTGALNRNVPPSHLNPLSAEPVSKHASVCRLEREIKAVKEENDRLKDQLEDTRLALKQITSEASQERFDERRVNMLKLQLIQLQRQVLLMSEALGSRSTSLMEVENALTWLSEKFRHYIGVDVRGAEVPVLRSDLMTMVDTSESARIKLFKNVENCSKENLSRPHMFMNSFLKPGLEKEFTLLDCCLGRPDCLNLKHVAQLESKLSLLYKELIKVSEHLTSRARDGPEAGQSHMSSAVREREGTVVLRAAAMARDCASDLLSLSLLVPSAPWPPLKKPTMSEVTYEALVPSLPPLPRGKAAGVQQCVTAALKACNHRCHMVGQEAGALREEVRFHQAVYQLQLDYILQAFEALRQGYGEFERSTNEVLIQPMKKLMEAYTKLKNNTSQEGLRDFLTVLKQHEQQWTDIIQSLDTSDPQYQSGSVALSAFGEEFMQSLNRLVSARQAQRDKATSQKEELKIAQQELEEELRVLIRDGEEQRKIARELKGKEYSVKPEPCNISQANSSSVAPDVSGSEPAEVSMGLRPWLDDHNADQKTSRSKKAKKTGGAVRLTQKPWNNGEDRRLLDGEDRRGRGKAETPDGGISSGFLRPWLDEPDAGAENGGEKADISAGTGLRPWLDEPYSAEESQGRRKPTKKPGVPEAAPAGDSFGACVLAQVLIESGTQALNSQRSVKDHTSSLESARSGRGESDHQFDASHSEDTHPLDTGMPPWLTDLASNCPLASSRKGKQRGAKAKNYEPKLYVANRTLSLRRSGSLTKLSEPSTEERMVKMSVLGQSKAESSRTNSRQSSR